MSSMRKKWNRYQLEFHAAKKMLHKQKKQGINMFIDQITYF